MVIVLKRNGFLCEYMQGNCKNDNHFLNTIRISIASFAGHVKPGLYYMIENDFSRKSHKPHGYPYLRQNSLF